MTEAEAVAKAYRIARKRGLDLDSADLREHVPGAARKLARLSLDADWREHLENDYALTISGRSASFTAQTDLLSDSIKVCNRITHPDVLKPDTTELLPFRILDHVDDLDFASSISQSLFAFAAVGASAVEFRYAASLATTLTVRAVRIPKVNASTFVIDNLPTQLDDLFLDLLIEATPQRAAA